MRKALREFGVPTIASDKRTGGGRGAVQVLSYLRVVANPLDDSSFLEALAVQAQGQGPIQGQPACPLACLLVCLSLPV